MQPGTTKYFPILVRPHPPGKFTAQPLGVPEITEVADRSLEAIEKARHGLLTWTGPLYWVPVEGPISGGQSLHEFAGHAKDDPDFDLYLEEIRHYRHEVDQRECPASSSTPTT